ncbi:enoyl-CoA hydratase-related protein [Bradyrhizobium sp. CCBAU 11361]|uniref:enoyl-CoA hydratase-related protein n=1 Tax=Bradyrhizobium sp. CCBAU 11361 TaxID=1630812 RepID=UPI0023026360|nr:enoyl-CoA hydratase-related protein [Bradyrhizobium sp. CCBAU 11361]MDA9489540.1 enoyl-CoA hydratase [Bradyrhizobium sp. CCBAU 11361]
MSKKLEIGSGADELLTEIRQHVAILTLNRPEAMNALTGTLAAALGKRIRCLAEDPQVRAILITGAGSAFCAGADVKRMNRNSTEVEQALEQRVADFRVEQRALVGALVAVRKPTVAAILGPAAGAGLALALACDIRVAAHSAILTTAYARIGLSGDYGIAWLLTQVAGFTRARELMFLSERIDAQGAEAIGLVSRVVPDGELSDAAFALAVSLARGPTVAFGRMKDNLDHAVISTFRASLDYEAENVIRTGQTLDHREGLRAFAEKRKPIFEGH